MAAVVFLNAIVIIACTAQRILPTIVNDTHEYYITSQSASQSFTNSTIACTNAAICIVDCDVAQNCNNLQIKAAEATQLMLYCSQPSSCRSLRLLNGPSRLLHIDCIHSQSCIYGNFYAPLTSNVHVRCNGSKACQYAAFNLTYCNYTNVECGATTLDDCMFSTFNVSHSSNVSFTNPHQHTSILAPVHNDSSLTIHCDTTCSAAQIYLFSRSVPVLNVTCGSYSSPGSSCDYLQFHCQDDDTTLPTNYLYVDELTDFRCDSDRCCPPPLGVMDDPFSWDCTTLFTGVVDQCRLNVDGWPYNQIIDASTATKLDLICNTEYECQHLDVRCPDEEECTLVCSAQAACEYVHILPATVSVLTVECSAAYSCRGMDISVTAIEYVNITCKGAFACSLMSMDLTGIGDETHIAVYALQDNAVMDMDTNIHDIAVFTVSCIGTGSCRNVYLSSEETQTLSVLSDSFGSNHTFENIVITHHCDAETIKVESCGKDIMFACDSNADLSTTNCTNKCIKTYNKNEIILPFNEETQTWQTCEETEVIHTTSSRPIAGIIMIIVMMLIMCFICVLFACCCLYCNHKEKQSNSSWSQQEGMSKNHRNSNAPQGRPGAVSMAELNKMAFQGTPSGPPLVQEADDSDSDDIYENHAGEEKQSEEEIVNSAEDGPLQAWMINVVQLPQYINVFIRNDITLDVMPEVDRNVLKEIGITSVGHQMSIIKHAKQLNLQQMGYSEGPKKPVLKKNTLSSTFATDMEMEPYEDEKLHNLGSHDEDLEQLLEQDEEIIGDDDDEKETQQHGLHDELIIGSEDEHVTAGQY